MTGIAAVHPFTLSHADGLSFRGDLHPPDGEGRRGVVVLAHGFKGFKDWGFFPHLADRIAEAGLAAIRFNFSLNGIGPDPNAHTELDKFAANTISQELRDLDLVLKTLRSGGLPGADRVAARRIGLLGHSRGGGIVLTRALDDPGVRAVCTWACIGGFDKHLAFDPVEWKRAGRIEVLNVRTHQRLPVNYSAWEDVQAHREAFDFPARLAALRAQALFVHCEGDPTVPAGASEMLAGKAPCGARLRLIPGGDHGFGAVHPFAGPNPVLEEAVRATSEFFIEHLR